MAESDKEFLEGVSERLEGFYPGIFERLEKLKSEQLGRAIVFPNTPEEVARGENKGRLMGYILPTRYDQLEHVLLFRNGLLLVTNTDIGIYGGVYREKFSPSEKPFDIHSKESIEELAKELTDGLPHYGCRVTLSSTQPPQMPQILEKVDQATLIAIETKTTRENIAEIIKKLDSIFEPPQELPPQAPPQQS